MIECRHFSECRHVPKKIRSGLREAANSTSSLKIYASSTKQFIEHSAKNKGLVETKKGLVWKEANHVLTPFTAPVVRKYQAAQSPPKKVKKRKKKKAKANSKAKRKRTAKPRAPTYYDDSSEEEEEYDEEEEWSPGGGGGFDEDEMKAAAAMVMVAASSSSTPSSSSKGAAPLIHSNTSPPSIKKRTYNNQEYVDTSGISANGIKVTDLLDRTRTELLNGRDFWMCTKCGVEVESLKEPCGTCHKNISFVPLDVEEFEQFVLKQREMRRKADMIRMMMRASGDSSDDGSSDDEVVTKVKKSRPKNKYIANKPDLPSYIPNKSRPKQPKKPRPPPKPKEYPQPPQDKDYTILDPDMPLVTPEMKDMATPYMSFIFEQMRGCNFAKGSASPSKNNIHKSLPVGFPGLQCKYCEERTFFYRDAETYSANYTHIPGHLMKCAPTSVTNELNRKKNEHVVLRKTMPKGSQRQFFDGLYARLHGT